MKKFLICVVLIAAAFAIGFGWGYLKLREAQKTWTATNREMQNRIASLERELTVAKARVALWEIPLALSQVSGHLADKNFGLATRDLDQAQDRFLKAQALLGSEWKGSFDFFLPAVEEIRKETQGLSPGAKAKTEDLRSRFEQTLKSLPLS
jgi:hypothetical protein